MDQPNLNRKYSDEEKQQLIANLDIEVAHRTRQFESWLADGLENFNIHQEGHVSRIPKQVRNMTMREFGEKYQGNIQAALRGVQKEKFAGGGGEAGLGETDKSTRKRKWVASQDIEEASGSGSGSSAAPAAAESSRTVKNDRVSPLPARLTTTTPKKKPGSSTGPGTAQRARLLAAGSKTPGTSRTMGRVPPTPSPQKSKPPFSASTHPATRPTSPSKHPASKPPHAQRQPPPPSSTSFNAAFLPPKTPIYPGTAMRLPRRDESMLSLNGSPLANPYELGLGWFGDIGQGGDADGDGREERKGQAKVNGTETEHTLKRSKSNIIIHRDAPFTATVNGNTIGGFHSRTNSQTSVYTSSSQAESSNHSQTNSQSTEPYSQPEQTSVYPPSQSQLNSTYLHPTATPKPLNPAHTRTLSHIASALVAIPTKDGQFIEFDPLQTSPGALDALDGITDSAKKQARLEMGRLVQAAVDKWKIR